MPETPQRLLLKGDSPVLGLIAAAILVLVIVFVFVFVFAFALDVLPGNGLQGQTTHLRGLGLDEKDGALGAATEGGQRPEGREIERGNAGTALVVVDHYEKNRMNKEKLKGVEGRETEIVWRVL